MFFYAIYKGNFGLSNIFLSLPIKQNKMKKILLLSIILLSLSYSFAQKKEKIKGSKINKVEIKPVSIFETLDVADNIEIFLVKGTSPSVEIDADENLHAIIELVPKGKSLYLSTMKTVISSKKFIIRITYTDDLKQVILHNDAQANSLTDLDLETIAFKNYDQTKLFITSKAKNFTLFLDDNSKAEINLKGEKSTLNLSKNSVLKALIVSKDINLDMYQKSEAKIEGDCNNLKVRLDNSTDLNAKNLVARSIDATAELDSKAKINAKTGIKISASGTSEIELYGEPRVDLVKFSDKAILKKMMLK